MSNISKTNLNDIHLKTDTSNPKSNVDSFLPILNLFYLFLNTHHLLLDYDFLTVNPHLLCPYSYLLSFMLFCNILQNLTQEFRLQIVIW